MFIYVLHCKGREGRDLPPYTDYRIFYPFYGEASLLLFQKKSLSLFSANKTKTKVMAYDGDNLIRFDWAMKRLLRQKANFVVLESFLSELFGEKVKIKNILESEDDEFNRVDLLAENERGELLLVEVQNMRELHYYQRMLYGTSKAITDYMYEGDKYSAVRKVYSVNIVYFDLGQGDDYIYHGKSVFKGVHTGDTLRLSVKQRDAFVKEEAGDLFPEYYILRVDEFNRHAVTPLDEWIRFLKSGTIDEGTQVEGLRAAKECLRVSGLSREERRAYDRHVDAVRVQWDVLNTAREEGLDEGRAEGRAEGLAEGLAEGEAKEKRRIALNLKRQGLPVDIIAGSTGLPAEEIEKL